MTSRRRIVALSLLAAIGTTALVSSGARAAESNNVLKLVPADAWGFVVIRSLETVDQRAAQLNDVLGMGLPSPVTPMALGMLGVGDAIDMKRPLCLAMMDVQKFGAENPGNAAVLMVPARDAKAMLQKFAPPPAAAGDEGDDAADKGKATAEGIQKISLMGQDSYAGIKGKYVIVGQNEDCVAYVLKTKKRMDAGFAKARSAALAKSDIYISISLRAIVSAYKDMLTMTLPMMMASFDPEGKTAEQLVKTLTEMDAFDMALGIEKDGVAMSYLVAPKDGSDLAKVMKGTKNVSGSLLSVLPKERYLAVLGATSNYDEEAAAKFGQQNMLSSIVKSSQMEGIDEEAVKAIDAESQNLLKSVKSVAICASALPEGGKDGLIGLTFAAETKDAKAFLAGARKIYKAAWKVSDDEDLAEIKKHVAYAEDAETVAGHKIDTVTIKLAGLADTLELEADGLKDAQTVLGKEWVFRFGAVDDKHFLCVFGGGKARFAKASKSLASKGGTSLADDAGIEALSKKLHSPRAAEGYFAVDNAVHLARAVAKAVGQEEEVPFDLPTLNAPVVFGSAQIGDIGQGDLFVPMKLVTAIKKAVEEASKAEMQNFDEDEDDDDEGDDDGE